MWKRKQNRAKRSPKFFYLSLSHDNLINHYQTNFALVQHHKYSLSELENMMPWEREVYLTMLKKWIDEENSRQNKLGK